MKELLLFCCLWYYNFHLSHAQRTVSVGQKNLKLIARDDIGDLSSCTVKYININIKMNMR